MWQKGKTMTKQPDNHIDELGAILENLQSATLAAYSHSNYGDMIVTARETAAQAIEDFYRNKILEARKDEVMFWHDQKFNYEPDEPCPYCMGEAYSLEHEVFTDRLNDITAQFNSKEEV